MSQPAALCGAGFGTLFYLLDDPAQEPRVPGQLLRVHRARWLARPPSATWVSSWARSSRAWCTSLIAADHQGHRLRLGQQAAAPGGHRPHRGADRSVPVRQRREQPDQHRRFRRQLQPGAHPASACCAFFVTVWASVKGSKGMKLVPVHHRHPGPPTPSRLALTFIGKCHRLRGAADHRPVRL